VDVLGCRVGELMPHNASKVSWQPISALPVVTVILALAQELKTGTIEAVLRKSDVEVALEALARTRGS
jgi:hypothetical protein